MGGAGSVDFFLFFLAFWVLHAAPVHMKCINNKLVYEYQIELHNSCHVHGNICHVHVLNMYGACIILYMTR